MSRYIDADDLLEITFKNPIGLTAFQNIIKRQPTADVVEGDKAQKEIDYWHDKAQSYEQTILKLSLNKVDVVEVVRCKDCKHRKKNTFCLKNMRYEDDNGFCSYGERGRYER